MGLRLEKLIGREKRILALSKKQSTVRCCFLNLNVTAKHGLDPNSSSQPMSNVVLANKRMAARQGFEPRLDVPKTSVLPLHHQA